MVDSSNKRISSRQPNAAFVVLIDAPTHSEVLLEPMDVSLGGFSVLLHDKPDLGEVIDCEVDILNNVFESCRMTVVRVEENDEETPTWTTGMSLEVPPNFQSSFKEALKAAFPEVGRDGQFRD
ncbi:MAG: hypothetical protein HOC91_01310 [Nitrospinaceae bacterium]|nr:hypothetical protein [Nitrospinaceae bacterium]MBT3435378.1 hypothetical protein [Nitrospinaceae bacterium]MBT3821399.1 hypothetical protein [Nitrospinaceae bacterium]MBT4429132.1 hypothetical protein [Nitrospinaceae bacterium]MBT5369320.1 hypothetical protein [Nitrospinaceae bacterium]